VIEELRIDIKNLEAKSWESKIVYDDLVQEMRPSSYREYEKSITKSGLGLLLINKL